MTREETKRYRYDKYYGDIVPKDRREAIIAVDPEDEYINMVIVKPKAREKDLEGEPISCREFDSLIRKVREDMKRLTFF